MRKQRQFWAVLLWTAWAVVSLTACRTGPEAPVATAPEETSVQTMEFHSTDRLGGGRTLRAKVWWRRLDGLSRVMLRLREPPDLRGAGLLLIEKKPRTDMFVYLPDLQKVRRVTTRMLSGSLFGSDFTYEDFQRLQGMELEGRSERLPDETLDGVSVHVIAHHPAPDTGSGYERVVTYVAHDTCLPLKSEMWERGERLRKVLTADRESVFQRDGVRGEALVLFRVRTPEELREGKCYWDEATGTITIHPYETDGPFDPNAEGPGCFVV